MSSSSRSDCYKNSGLTVEKLRKERLEENQNLRQRKREEELNKLRRLTNDDDDETKYMDTLIFEPEVISALSGSGADTLRALKIYKNYLVKSESSSAVQDLLSLGVVSIICEIVCRSDVNTDLLKEALSTLAYSSVMDDELMSQWLNENILKRFLYICSFPYDVCGEMLESIVLILNNGFGVSATFYKNCTELEFFNSFLRLYQEIPSSAENLELRKLLLFFFNFYCQYTMKASKDAKISFDYSNIAIENSEFRARMLQEANNGDGSSLMDTCEELMFTLLCLTDCTKEYADSLVDANFIPLFGALINLSIQSEYGVPFYFRQKSILKLFGIVATVVSNIAKRGSSYTKPIHEAGITQNCWKILAHDCFCSHSKLRGDETAINKEDNDIKNKEYEKYKYSARVVIEEILRKDATNCETLLERGHINSFVQMFEKCPFHVRRESLLSLNIILRNGTKEVISHVVNSDIIMHLCDMLTVMDIRSVLCSMECLDVILSHGEAKKKLEGYPTNPYRLVVENFGIVDKLEFLTRSTDTAVFCTASDMLDIYFKDEDDEETLVDCVASSSRFSSIVDDVVNSVNKKFTTSNPIFSSLTSFNFEVQPAEMNESELSENTFK